jgi:hypothetical protein
MVRHPHTHLESPYSMPPGSFTLSRAIKTARKIEQISIGAADRERLERLVRDRNTPQKVVWRARIVLLAADGLNDGQTTAWVTRVFLGSLQGHRHMWHSIVQSNASVTNEA